MVIADHNGAFKPNTQSQVRFTQPGAVMKATASTAGAAKCACRTNAVEMGSWDYRTRAPSPGGGSAAPAATGLPVQPRCPGRLCLARPRAGRAHRRNQMQALRGARSECISAPAPCARLAPGTTFTLHGQARFDRADDDDGADLRHRAHRAPDAQQPERRHARRCRQAAGPGALRGRATSAAEPALQARAARRASARCTATASTRSAASRALPQQRRRRAWPAAASASDRARPADRDRGRSAGRGDPHRPRPPHQGAVPLAARRRQPQPPRPSLARRPHRRTRRRHRRHLGARGHAAGRAAPTGAAICCRASARKCWSISWKAISTGRWSSASLYNGRGQADAAAQPGSQGAGRGDRQRSALVSGRGGGHAHPAVLSGFKTQAMQDSQSGRRRLQPAGVRRQLRGRRASACSITRSRTMGRPN